MGKDYFEAYDRLPPFDENKLKFYSCIQTISDNADLPVKFQFALSADKQTFEMVYSDFKDERPDAILDFIYH